MKKFWLTLGLCLMISACGDNTKQEQQKETSDAQMTQQQEQEPSIPAVKQDGSIYQYQKASLPETCDKQDEILCAIENVIKCALNPKGSYCDQKTMPDFIFYDDSMFADDNGLGRPTEQSFEVIKTKTVDDNTIEVFTKGTCDKNWFGNCAGNIIYILNNKSGKWIVKELYALENI